MADMKELQEQITALSSEVAMLKERVTVLEGAARAQQHTPSRVPVPVQRRGWERVADHSQSMKNKLSKEGLESIIGGKLLNRLGILVLLFGVGYFLKYSFDNQWIGELGRVVIGFLGGLGLLIAGDLVMRRKYRIFSQGLTGGGIATIYLTTFAATNFYHLIGSGTSFVLLVLTALTGGLLSVRQNAFGVAVLATLGGFLSPFLIGSQEANPVGLLGYVAILDLAVLYLANYKQWRSLNSLAFMGTGLVYVVYGQTSSAAAQETLWINQGFLTLYFIIFGTLAFWHNLRHGQATQAKDVMLLVLNASFFFLSSAANLDALYADWLGALAILMAMLYLLVALGLHRRKQGDTLLFLALLGTGLAFVTIAIPLQLQEDRVVASAWLVEAIALVYGGLKGENRWVRRAGLGLLSFVALTVHLDSPYFVEPPIPVINFYSVACSLSVIGFFFVAHFFQHSNCTGQEKKLVWPAAVVGTVLAVKQITWEVANGLQYFELDYSVNFSVSLAWLLFALFLMILGLLRDLKGFRYLSLALFCLTTAKVMLVDLVGLAMIFRVLILMIVGVILVGVSFIYLRGEKEEQK